jgi:tetratricopeptide (TPR) repeat protein
MKHFRHYAAAAGIGLLLGAAGELWGEVRFDHVVRNDFFSGFLGDKVALQRGMETTEKVLAENPKHAEALVWHGSGLFFQGGSAFQQGDREKGMALTQKGVAEMDLAVKLEPENIGVRIPRGAALAAAVRVMPDSPFRAGLLQRALDDHQRSFDLQKDQLDKLGVHPLGELLQALGDLNSRMGKADEAQKYYEMILSKMSGSAYAKRASAWMETKQPLPAGQTTCIGCHVSK